LITGGFGLNFVRPMPVLRVSLHRPGITTSFVAVEFLVDTGSTDSYLHAQDAIVKIGLRPAALSTPTLGANRRSTHGIGGQADYVLQPAVYVFHHDDGALQQIQGSILVAELTASNATPPSILGWNMLRYFRIELDYVNELLTLR
jgi:hypothetical protein